MRLNFLIIFFLSILNVNIDFFLFKIFLSKLFSFDLFLIIDFENNVTTTSEIIDKKKDSLLLIFFYRRDHIV